MGLLGLIRRSKTRDKVSAAPVLRELPQPASPAVEPPPAAPLTSAELRQSLFDAIATGNEERLTELCREHKQFIHDYAPTWLIVPESLRSNADAAKWYARGLRQLLQEFCDVPRSAITPKSPGPVIS